MNIKGYKSTLDAVLSGEFELCIFEGGAFIRSPLTQKGQFIALHISMEEAEEIKKYGLKHGCIFLHPQSGSMKHYQTRSFPKERRRHDPRQRK